MAKDIYHNIVRTALEKDGWTITHDPLRLPIGERSVFVDLGAERLLTAEKEGQKIAVEIKSFVSQSPMKDLENALGQYILYQEVLEYSNINRQLYLAIRDDVYFDLFSETIGRILIERKQLNLIIFDPEKEEITKWIS